MFARRFEVAAWRLQNEKEIEKIWSAIKRWSLIFVHLSLYFVYLIALAIRSSLKFLFVKKEFERRISYEKRNLQAYEFENRHLNEFPSLWVK